MITELKIGDKVKLEGYDEAWIGWVTNSSIGLLIMDSNISSY
jgi:hypothetical protein